MCRIVRLPEMPPLEDQPTQETPAQDDPMEDDVQGVQNIPTGIQETTGEEPRILLVYEGPCRVYDKHTTTDKGDVITSFRGLSLPMTREDWRRLGIFPNAGDKINVDRGGDEEYGLVVDSNPSNFGGTHILWRYGRN